MYFASDNGSGVAAPILDAILRAGEGAAPGYGGDEVTRRAQARVAEIFETDCAAYFVTTGSAANGLGLACMSPPFGTILCHEASHIHLDECGCPEFYTGGAKLQPLPGAHGKLTPEGVDAYLDQLPRAPPHSAPPSVLCLTQATESGTVYSVDEVAALCGAARAANLRTHMDGSRFANALAATGATPAEMTWKAGIDVMTLGATKNGCLAAEAVVFFDRSLAAEFEHRRKRGGHLWSKMRFLSAQFEAYLTDGLWLSLAAQANAMARRLSEGLGAIDGVAIVHPPQINEVFAVLPPGMADRLRAQGAVFHDWRHPGDTTGGRTVRLICSFETRADDVDRLLAIARG